MKRTAANARSVTATCRQIVALMATARQFVPQDRGEAMIRKWLSRLDIDALGADRMVAAMAHATLLAADLLLSYPATSGATAFDRLARSRAAALAAEAALITALRQARFRLLRASDAHTNAVTAHDVLSGDAVQIVGAVLPSQARGAVLFARVVMLGDDRGCFPGPITLLDSAALAVARDHSAAGAMGAMAGVRWAEAVYAHVVQHGTLEVPGLNRPTGGADDDLSDVDAALFALATDWAALADAAPDPDLLQRSRQSADLPSILDALAGAAIAGAASEATLASGFERLLLVQLETVLQRERSGAGTLRLEAIERSVNAAIAADELPAAARTLFATLCQRVRRSNGVSGGDDPT